MAIIHLRKDKERPLTIEEVDSNFDLLNREVGQKFDASEFNAENILYTLDGHAGAGSTLNADMVHSMYPDTEPNVDTIVARDESGNVAAAQFHGLHVGNVIGNIIGNGTGTWTGNSTNVDGVVQVEHGGTGAANAPLARINLGCGNMAVQNKNTIDITGGTITGITDLAVADGGTGASNAINARSNLGLVIGSDVQAYAAILSGLSLTSGDGILVRSSSNAGIVRTLVAGNSIDMTNTNGKDGNPTIGLSLTPTISALTKTGTDGVGDIGQSGNRFATIYSAYLNTNGQSTPYITKSGTANTGDIGQSDNRYATTWSVTNNANYVTVNTQLTTPNVVKSGTDSSGDIGQSNNRYGTLYTAYVNTNGQSTPYITKSGTDGNGDIGQSNNRFSTIYGNFINVSNAALSSITKTGGDGAGDIGQSNNRFGTLYGRATSAVYADLAEKYVTDKKYEPGTVIVVAEGGDAEATQSFKHDQRVLGVVSTNPAHVMNDGIDGQAIGLTGRLPVKVVGPIRKGQPIVSTPDGKATVGDSIYTFGQALETNLEQGVKLVECIIK